MKKIKPCPFCGCKRKNKIIETNYRGEYRTEHFCKFTILGQKFHKSEEEAIKEWNSRIGN